MKDGKFDLKIFMNNIEVYIGSVLFIIIMFLLTAQVISRYVFRHSITWTEELAVIMFVWMTYLGVSGAVTYRKHLRIDAFINVCSFKVKKILLIVSDLIFIGFNIYVIFPLLRIINSLGAGKSAMLGIPKKFSYIIIPVMLGVSCIRIVQDIVKLVHEQEDQIGASKPALDLEACEREAKEKLCR